MTPARIEYLAGLSGIPVATPQALGLSVASLQDFARRAADDERQEILAILDRYGLGKETVSLAIKQRKFG